MSQPAAVSSASLARSSPRCQLWSSLPRFPSGCSRLWSGPATKPSSEIDMWQVVSGIATPLKALTICTWWPATHQAAKDPGGARDSRGDLLGEEGGEPVEQQAGAVLALRRILEVVEERAVLGEDEPRAVAVGPHLDGRQRHGDESLVEQEVVGEDDPLTLDDVVVAAAELVQRPARIASHAQLAAADTEVELPIGVGPALGHAEPALLELGVRERAERLRRGLAELSLDREVVLADAHRRSPWSVGKASSRTSRRRSKCRSQIARCSAIHCSSVRIGPGSSRHVRTRPTFSERTRPLRWSTSRCCITDGSDMSSGAASSLTEAAPRDRRTTIARRLSSASAWNARSSCAAPAVGMSRIVAHS